MSSSLAFIRDDLAAHPLAKWFRINLQEISSTKLLLGLTAQDESAAALCDSAGLCALLVDYGARKLGQENLGCCVVNECEISICDRVIAQEWLLAITLESVAPLDASFACRIFAELGGRARLMAESQGTLIRKQKIWN
jgi:hypothetical protein